MINKSMLLSFIVPVFNEQDSITAFLREVDEVSKNFINVRVEYIFVNDGSSDNTINVLLLARELNSSIKIVDLSRNFGKEAALTAGLEFASGDIVVPIDVDLQDPPELIQEMIEKWREGYDVVLARRVDRSSDTWAKRKAANSFYHLHNLIADEPIPENVGDFRLMDRKVVDAVNSLPESRRFMKGILAWIGFKTSYVDYCRRPRSIGETKFSGWKLWNLALEGITSFSTLPLRIWSYIGFVIALLSLSFSIFIVIKELVWGIEVPGYSSVIVAITFLGGLQLLGIGAIGEYLGRTYIEAKNRPIYIVQEYYK